jgi:glycosyltransferase involved in cell wall biosynthesis/acyl carrier protein
MRDEVANALLEEVQRLTVDRRRNLHIHSPLLDGTLDSLTLLDLISFVERRYQISVNAGDVTSENFGSALALSAYIEARRRTGLLPVDRGAGGDRNVALRILMIHPDAMFPPAHGGSGCMRSIAESLAARGQATSVLLRLCPAANRDDLFAQNPASLPVGSNVQAEGISEFTYARVNYVTCGPGVPFVQAVRSLIETTSPDLVLLTEGALVHDAEFLDSVLEHSSAPVVLFVWTLAGLPFGPAAAALDERADMRFQRVNTVVVPGEYAARYVALWSGREARMFRFPVFGSGPFPMLADPTGPVLFVNPCKMKGLPIALDLMRQFPAVTFRVVPGWGTTAHDLAMVRNIQNVEIVPRQEGIAGLLEGTSAVLFPSLVEETFPLVPIEAMLRGVPVLGSNIGAVPEAMLGCRHVLPAQPLERLHFPARACAQPYWHGLSPPQDTAPWAAALRELRASSARHAALSSKIADTARAWVASLSWEPVMEALIGTGGNAASRESRRV